MLLPNRKLPLRRALTAASHVLAFTVLALPLVARELSAQRRSGPLVLRAPSSARVLALGNAGAAITDADAVFSAPAMLITARGASASVQRYGGAATHGSVSTISTVGGTTIGLGAQVLDWRAPALPYGEVLRNGTTTLSDGGEREAGSQLLALGLARVFKGQRLGVAVKYAEERIGGESESVVAVDLGYARAFGPGALSVTVQNLGMRPQLGDVRVPLPLRYTVGFGGGMMPMGEYLDMGAQVQLSVDGDGFVRPAGGIELGYVPIEGVSIVWRQGLRLPREPDESLITAGVGLTVDRLSVDYSVEPMRGGRPVSHRVGLRLR
jgi:hypothetical protein